MIRAAESYLIAAQLAALKFPARVTDLIKSACDGKLYDDLRRSLVRAWGSRAEFNFLIVMQALRTDADVDRRLRMEVQATDLTSILKDINDFIQALRVSRPP